MSSLERIPPQNLDAEQSTLGSMMIDRDALMAGGEELQAEDFYRSVHQVIFTELVAISKGDEPADLITLQEELRKRNRLEDIGGTEYLMALVDTVPTAANIGHYANIVVEKSTLRQVQALGTELIGAASDETQANNIVELAVSKVLALAERKTVKTRSMMDICLSASERVKRMASGGDPREIPFRMDGLRRILYGMCPGDLGVVMAKSGGGKTVQLLDFAATAGSLDRPILLLSLEMDAEALVIRMACADEGLDMHDVRAGNVDDDVWVGLSDSFARYTQMPITIWDQEITLTGLQLLARRWRIQHREAIDKVGGLIIIDYLGIVRFDGKYDGSVDADNQKARAIKALTRELDVSTWVGAQPRKRDARGPKSFDGEDIRGGGGTLNEADIVIAIEAQGEAGEDGRQPIEFNIIKHRNGPTGIIRAWFDKPHQRFVEIDGYHLPPVTAVAHGSKPENYDERYCG